MAIQIDWFAFLQVFAAALVGATVVVGAYAGGLRLLVRAGHAPVVLPAEFTDAITVVSDKQRRRAEKAAAKAAKRSPLTQMQKRLAFLGAVGCFVLSAAGVLAGIVLLVAAR